MTILIKANISLGLAYSFRAVAVAHRQTSERPLRVLHLDSKAAGRERVCVWACLELLGPGTLSRVIRFLQEGHTTLECL